MEWFGRRTWQVRFLDEALGKCLSLGADLVIARRWINL
jgi:hypothetical protein